MKEYTVEVALYGDTEKDSRGKFNRLPYEIHLNGNTNVPLGAVSEKLDERDLSLEELMAIYNSLESRILDLMCPSIPAYAKVIYESNIISNAIDKDSIFNIARTQLEVTDTVDIPTYEAFAYRLTVNKGVVIHALERVRDKCVIRFFNDIQDIANRYFEMMNEGKVFDLPGCYCILGKRVNRNGQIQSNNAQEQ